MNTSLSSSVTNLDNTKNYILMLKDESFTNAITIDENKKVTLNLNEKTLQYNGSADSYGLHIKGVLTVNGGDSSITGTGKSFTATGASILRINGGVYNAIGTSGTATLTVKDSTFQCSENKNNCYPIFLGGSSNSTFENIEVKGSLGKSFGMNANSNATVNGANFECLADNCVWTESNGSLLFDNVNISSYGYGLKTTSENGRIEIKNSTFNTGGVAVAQNTTNSAVINIYNSNLRTESVSVDENGTIISKHAVYLYTNGTVNIYDSTLTAMYGAALYLNGDDVSSTVNGNSILTSDNTHTIYIAGNGNLIINGGTINGKKTNITNAKNGIANINGGVYNVYGSGTKGAITNVGTSTINICAGTINGLSTEDKYDLYNQTTGYIKYKSNVSLKNNTIYDTNNPTQVILDDTITCG